MNILYCECFSGISGDMFLAAMIDAGMPQETLDGQLQLLNLSEYKGIKAVKILKGGIRATRLEFDLAEHDGHEHHGHSRNLGKILELIADSPLKDSVKQTASAIFTLLGKAEAKIHGTALEEVHFHEVGAADSILDIVGAAVALDYYHIDSMYSSPLPLGSGTIQTRHGLLPVPAPATLELLVSAQAKVTSLLADKELVTPTGAAILAALAKFEQPGMKLRNVGMGAGYHEFAWPNVMRVLIGESNGEEGSYIEIETNIDDMSPQFYGSVMQHLFDRGALDVYFTPIHMKKNRPAIKVSIIADVNHEAALSQVLLRETSTLGVRVKVLKKHEAYSTKQQVRTKYGPIWVKMKLLEGKIIQASPEYDDCLELGERLGIPVMEVHREALMASGALISQEKSVPTQSE